jgi:hypothetical protein
VAASVIALLAACGWMCLFPLVSISTGEAKPRNTFISENAILQHASPAFSEMDVSQANAAAPRPQLSVNHVIANLHHNMPVCCRRLRLNDGTARL